MSLPEKAKEPTSRYAWAHIMMLLAGFIIVAQAEVPFDPPGTYATSWLGNTYMDANGYKVVTEELADICVSPNGHLFSAGYAEAWGGGAEYNAVTGAFIARYDRFESGFGDPVKAVAADNTCWKRASSPKMKLNSAALDEISVRGGGSQIVNLPLSPATALTANTNTQLSLRLEVSANHRFLVTSDGQPFFYLGDTAWALFSCLTREEAAQSLGKRWAQGFTVIQAALTFRQTNIYGRPLFLENDPARPAMTPGSDPASPEQYDFWDHADYIIDQAAHHGLYVGLLPVWGIARPGRSPIFNEISAEAYGKFLGARYKDKPIIWILGGDQSPEGNEGLWRAMARGIAVGVTGSKDYGKVLITYHPYGYSSSSATWFHNEPWLDFNMQQNGHKRNWPVYDKISNDYHRAPPKPTMDAEPSYEWHPVDFDIAKGRVNPHDVRTFAYWEVFAGACGFTYGHYLVFPFSRGDRDAGSDAVAKGGWLGALDAPAALQMKHLKQLVLSRSYLDRVPDQQLLSDCFTVADHVRAARGRDYAFFYTPTGKAFTVRMGRISGATVKAHWYDPRNGTCTAIGVFPNSGNQRFTPPTSGTEVDWLLVLDDAAKDFPDPGTLNLNK